MRLSFFKHKIGSLVSPSIAPAAMMMEILFFGTVSGMISAVVSVCASTATASTVEVHCPLGPGYTLKLTGSGEGLSWEIPKAITGQELPPGSGNWKFEVANKTSIEVKPIVVNPSGEGFWFRNDNLALAPGQTLSVEDPHFKFPPGKVEVRQAPELNNRTIRVYTPVAYDQNRHSQSDQGPRFPVVYALDGQDFFDSWQAAQMIDQTIGKGLISPAIVVAADNAGEDRIDEYTFSKDPERPYPTGGGKAFAEQWVPRWVAWTDQNYRTIKDRNSRSIIGSSLGGLEASYIGFQLPQLFSKVAALSASYWWNHFELPDEVPNLVQKIPPKLRPEFYIDMGDRESAEESDRIEALEGARDMTEALLKAKYQQGTSLIYREIPGGTHDGAAWKLRLPQVLTNLLKNQPLKSIIESSHEDSPTTSKEDCVSKELHKAAE